MSYVIVSPDPQDPERNLYLREAGDDHCYWTGARQDATVYATYGHAKASAARRLSRYRHYLIRELPIQGKAR